MVLNIKNVVDNGVKIIINHEKDQDRTSILQLTDKKAKDFFLKPETYCPLLLPSYIDFSKAIDIAKNRLSKTKNLSDLYKDDQQLSDSNNVNYTLLINKDGLYDWRPITILHPLVYVSLVNLITDHKNWEEITKKFEKFQDPTNKIECISIPVVSTGKNNDKSETILNWWESLEQASIKYALEYTYCVKTDVTNCYGSIYTHSIAWALMGEEKAKHQRKKNKGLGNKIDKAIQEMQYGQTNGIPQGGPIFDLIAEIILGYSDLLLTQILSKKFSDFKILRYRDDYRIFTNSKETAHSIVKELSTILSNLNMHFNSKKTLITTDIIDVAVKEDKRFWTQKREIIQTKQDNKIIYHLTLQKQLLMIYELSKKFPNSGSLTVALQEFIKRISSKDNKTNMQLKKDAEILISILVNILTDSPKIVPQAVTSISIILKKQNKSEFSKKIVTEILRKFKNTPNIGYVYVWLQRLTITNNIKQTYDEPLCKLVDDPNTKIWNSSWLRKEDQYSTIINKEIIQNLSSDIKLSEIETFTTY